MGLAKRLATARFLGLPVSRVTMLAFGAHLVQEPIKRLKGEGDDDFLVKFLQAGPYRQPADPEPVTKPIQASIFD